MTMIDGLSPVRAVVVGCLLALVIQLLSLRIDKVRTKRKKTRLLGCVKPRSYPLKDPFFGIDVMYEAFRAARSKTFLQQKRNHYERYGNTFTTRISTFSVINTIEPENIKQVLSTTFKDYEVGLPRRNAFSQILNECIFTNDGSEWEHSRSLLRPLFSKGQTGDLSVLDIHVENLIGAIPDDRSTVDLNDLFLRYTADVTTDFVFGDSIKSLTRPDLFQVSLMKAFQIVQQGAARNFRLGVFAKLIPQPTFNQALEQVHKYADQHIDKAIGNFKSRRNNPNEKLAERERRIFLRELLETTEDCQALRNELLAIFFAGRDTTSALLSNMFFVFARMPHVWEQIRDEVSPLEGVKPTLDELRGMKYLGWCLNETLRLYPIIPNTSRTALKDTILPKGGGANQDAPVFVAAGTLVQFHISALHQRGDLWGPDVDDFCPERWQKEKTSWKYLPFGGGPRNCIGQQFAITETLYTVVRLAQRFSSVASRDPEAWTECLGASCSSANGVKVALTPVWSEKP